MVRPLQRTRLLLLAVALMAAAAVPWGQSSYEKDLDIRTSRIPHAGNGVFTKVAIPKGTYLGAYGGEFITEEEFLRRAAAGRWQYMMGLRDCAKPQSGGLVTIDGINGNVFTRMNFAPAEFQNVTFEKVCETPFVKVVALRDITAGEELWVDYGPRYHYDFMNDPEVIAFFASLRARRANLIRTVRSAIKAAGYSRAGIGGEVPVDPGEVPGSPSAPRPPRTVAS